MGGHLSTNHVWHVYSTEQFMCLRKYDHVSLHRHRLNWLPTSHQIIKSACAMCRHYHHDKQLCLLLDPPIMLGAQHSYNTQCKDCFVNPLSYPLSTTKKYFCSSATPWWNSFMKSITIDCNYNSFVFLCVCVHPACMYVVCVDYDYFI